MILSGINTIAFIVGVSTLDLSSCTPINKFLFAPPSISEKKKLFHPFKNDFRITFSETYFLKFIKYISGKYFPE